MHTNSSSREGKWLLVTFKNLTTFWLIVIRNLSNNSWNKSNQVLQTVNGLLIPGRYVEQVTSPDILPPDFKYPYLYVPTHLCSQTLCSQLLFPITLMYPHIYIFWRYVPIFSVSFEGFHSVLSWCGFNWCRIHGKNMQSFYLLLLQSSRANYQFLVCYWASSCFLMCWRIPSIAKKSPPGRFTRWICSAWRGRRHISSKSSKPLFVATNQ